MNERIDKLLVKAGAYFGGEGVVYDTFDPKKFAELIVRKCADIGERYADGNYEIRNQIMIQFGLEEPEE
jgi:hypothetical protein